MVGDKGKKQKVGEKGEEENADHIDEKLVLSIEKLQEIQDELEKVSFPPLFPSPNFFFSSFYVVLHSAW